MEVRFRDGGALKRVVDAVKDLTPDVSIIVDGSSGIKWEAMDSSHVSFVSVSLRPSSFEWLKIGDAPIALGVNLPALNKILKCGNSSDTVTWRLTDEERNKLDIVLSQAEKKSKTSQTSSGSRTSEHKLQLTQIDCESLAVPDTTYDTNAFMRSSTLQRVLKDLGSFATESMWIRISKRQITFSIEGDHGSSQTSLPNIVGDKTAKPTFD